MFDAAAVSREFNQKLDQLTFETDTVYRELISHDWYDNVPRWPFLTYSYMMHIFARIDLLSWYWEGKKGNQTTRMIDFLNTYVHPGRIEEHRVAVQMWRHALMHTGEPRRIYDAQANKRYTWVIYLDSSMDPRPHYSVYEDKHDNLWVLVTHLRDMVADLRRGQDQYLIDLIADKNGLQTKYLNADQQIRNQCL